MVKRKRKPVEIVESPEFWSDFPFRYFQHDAYFKFNMQDLEFAREFFLWAVPEISCTQIDLSGLKQEKESFLTDELTSSYADLLFQAPLNLAENQGTGKSCKGEFDLCVFFLIEHKSKNDRWTVFQIVRYIVRVWEEWLSKNEKLAQSGQGILPFVLPIVFYHGERRYSGPTDFQDLIQTIPGLEKYLPHWPFCLIDAGGLTEDQLPGNWKLRLLVRVTQSIFCQDILQRLSGFYEEARLHFAEPKAKEFFKNLLYYIGSSGQYVDPDKFIEEVKTMSELEVDLSTAPWWKVKGYEIYDSGVVEGIAIGRAEGEAEGEIKGKLDILILILTKRFGSLPESAAAKIKGLKNLDEINRLSDIALDIPALDDFMAQIS